MAAAVRGGSRVQAKSPARAPQKAARSGPAAAPARAARRAPKPARDHHGPSAKVVLIGAAAILALATVGALATGHRGQRLAEAIGSGVDARFGAAGFRLKTIEVQGASPMATADIVKAAGVYKNQPILGLNLTDLRKSVERVGWVKEARVVRLLPDTLVVAVVEHRQLAVWQHAGRQLVIDDHGQVIKEADPARFATLPLVVGDGAAAHAPEILPVIAQRPRLIGQMDALVRVDDRRWDVRMKDGSLIQLPADNVESALMHLERLDQRSRILELGFDRIDLRNPDVVSVRPRPNQALPVQTQQPSPTAAGQ
ncbi:cell division protein FtsQ/DivIB [Phenylobacterium sp.]|uniref:cell division protein FtsQ/DivIB n=1 Tax=Phenylobacterium sp. TaxID=1871053 RepID=UPI002CFB3B4C|nr:cell division protein FtsQ/DivIB [Phenylobacterium sp.]HLZ75152.1 cell division protein FtsQ/DivIB [Phenylobacterium sp.]